jgi:aspartyl-tRNA(Asn)/glutamyl-tRNA(Gln) amidotransferase subunit B
MRLEPNINLHITKDGKLYKTPIVEVKNLGSLKALEASIAYEIKRQLAEFQKTGITIETGCKSTRGWNDGSGETFLQREKEEAHDYRYFPDPDLMPVVVETAWVDSIKSSLPELPILRRQRFQTEFGFTEKDATTLVEDKQTADLFETALKSGAPVKYLCNHFISFWAMHANSRNTTIAQLGISPEKIGKLAKMVGDGKINPSAAAVIAEKMLTADLDPQTIAEKENLLQVSDTKALEAIIDEVLSKNASAVEDARQPGKKQQKAFSFLLGQVMQRSKGQANPQIVNEILKKKIEISP